MPRFSRLALSLALVAGAAAPVLAQDAATVIARVGTAEITLGHAIALRQQLPEQLQAAPNERLFPVLVEQMIDQELLAQSQAGQLAAGDQMRLDNELRGFLSGVALAAAIELAVTDPNITAAYDAFAAEFGAGEPVTEWNAAHILLRSEEDATAAAAALAEGRDFAEVAREVSTDGSAQRGGELGWFGPGMMIPEFEEAVRALEVGQVSGPVQSRYGWHLIRVAETRIATVPPLAAVREELVAELRREAIQTLINSLRAGATVANLTEGLDPALLRRDDLLAQ